MNRVQSTPNLCEPTSWWQGASRIVAHLMEFVREEGEGVWVYRTNGGAHAMWIDLSSGNVFGEDDILMESPEYRPLVEVQLLGHGKWVQFREGEDYRVNYAEGEVVMLRAIRPESKVRASFYKAGSSDFCFDIGQADVQLVTLQFASGIELRSDLIVTATRCGEVVESKRYKSLFNVAEDAWGGSWSSVPTREGCLVRVPIRVRFSGPDCKILVRLDGDRPVSGERASVSVHYSDGGPFGPAGGP